MIALTKRNMKLFFRDRTSVFFSLLAVFIIIGLYVLFLGDMITEGIDLPGTKTMMDNWIMAGMLAVASVTTTMGAFGTLVDDRVKKIRKDFTASPLHPRALTAGYILSSYATGVIMTVFALVFAEIYIISGGGGFISAPALLKVLGLILLSTLASSAMIFFIVSFFQSQSAFATASSLIGTLIGFLSGIYIPIGTLPPAMQAVVKIFPVSHAAALFRQVMMADSLAVVFSGVPEESVQAFNETMGINYRFGDASVTPLVSILILVVTTVAFYLLALQNLSKKRK